MAEIKRMRTHLVLKLDKIVKALNEEEQTVLFGFANRVEEKYGKSEFFVCNIDEPYAKEVLDTILRGEDKKEAISTKKDEAPASPEKKEEAPAQENKKKPACPLMSKLMNVPVKNQTSIVKGGQPSMQLESRIFTVTCMEGDCKWFNKKTGKCKATTMQASE